MKYEHCRRALGYKNFIANNCFTVIVVHMTNKEFEPVTAGLIWVKHRLKTCVSRIKAILVKVIGLWVTSPINGLFAQLLILAVCPALGKVLIFQGFLFHSDGVL